MAAHADLVAVRRAYAQRLRTIDAGADPDAFERLRSAYESAREWCIQEDAAGAGIPPDEPTVLAVDADAEPEPEPEPAVVPTADQAAAEALAQLQAGLPRATGDEGVQDLLQLIAGTLRFGYIDAPGQFEDMLIDALRGFGMERRAAVFDAAATVFHWDEVGRVHGNDVRMGWVTRVLAQREIWKALHPTWRMTWFALMAQARERIDADIAKRWPDVAQLSAMLPDWITLHLTPAQLAGWHAAFNDLSVRERDKAAKRAAPTSAMTPATTRRGRRPAWRRALGVAWVLAMLVSCLNHVGSMGGNADGEPLPRFSEAAPSIDECARLYARLDGPEPFKNVAKDEIVQTKRRAQRCALDGHWQAPSR